MIWEILFPALTAHLMYVEMNHVSSALGFLFGLIQAKRLGTSEADLLRSYPTLRAEDLTNAWAYYRSHKEEIEQQIQENEEA